MYTSQCFGLRCTPCALPAVSCTPRGRGPSNSHAAREPWRRTGQQLLRLECRVCRKRSLRRLTRRPGSSISDQRHGASGRGTRVHETHSKCSAHQQLAHASSAAGRFGERGGAMSQRRRVQVPWTKLCKARATTRSTRGWKWRHGGSLPVNRDHTVLVGDPSAAPLERILNVDGTRIGACHRETGTCCDHVDLVSSGAPPGLGLCLSTRDHRMQHRGYPHARHWRKMAHDIPDGVCPGDRLPGGE